MVHNLSEKVSAHTATKHELIIIVHFSLSNSNFQLTSVYKVDTPAYDNPMYDPPPIVLPNDTTVVELSTFKKYVIKVMYITLLPSSIIPRLVVFAIKYPFTTHVVGFLEF